MGAIIPLGKLAAADAGRDAIHIAVAPVIAGMDLSPGDRVGIAEDGKAWTMKMGVDAIGIVDPYLNEIVLPGERFYLCLYPNTITSLRHHWVHPAFKEDPPPSKEDFEKAQSEAWLRKYATVHKLYTKDPEEAYQSLLSDLRGKYLCYEGRDMHGFQDLQDADGLKEHAQVVLGIPINFNDDGWTFTCSC